MNIEKKKTLIELVKKYPILYNCSLKENRDKDKKLNTWNRISTELGFSVEACTKQWTSLRDTYGKKKKKARKVPPNGSGAKRKDITWPFYQLLYFLDPFTKSRVTSINLQTSCVEEDDNEEICLDETDYQMSQTLDKTLPEELIFSPVLSSALPSSVAVVTTEGLSPISSSSKTLSFHSSGKRKPDFSDIDGNKAELMRTLSQHLQKKEESVSINRGFGQEIASRLDLMTYQQQALAKIRIEQVLYEIHFRPSPPLQYYPPQHCPATVTLWSAADSDESSVTYTQLKNL